MLHVLMLSIFYCALEDECEFPLHLSSMNCSMTSGMFEKATCQLEPGFGPKPPFENLTSEKMIKLNFNC